MIGVSFMAVFFTAPNQVQAQTAKDPAAPQQPQVMKGRVIKEVGEQTETGLNGQPLPLLQVELLTGTRQGETATASAVQLHAGETEFSSGQKVVVETAQTTRGEQLVVADYLRLDDLAVIIGLFAAAVLVVSRKTGLKSLLSMALSLVVIVKLLLPLLIKGVNPILVSLLGAVVIIPTTFYLSHGWNRKTHTAVLGTVAALAAASLLASLMVSNAHLSGFTSDEAGFLQVEQQGQLNIQGLLLASIIIGLLGTLDDITVTQAGFVFQLNKHNSKLTIRQLYQEAMEVGQDHIASMVNTLVLVYTGAALPLLLLFINNPQPLWYVFNQELVAEEIIRTLVGSIGLVLAAPLTTIIAAAAANRPQLAEMIKVKK